MKAVKIDLGEGGPSASVAVDPAPSEKYYPTIHYSGSEELNIPKEGEMKIRYKKTASGHSEHNGKTTYNCTIEVREIVGIEKAEVEESVKIGTDASNALDAIARDLKSKKNSEDY